MRNNKGKIKIMVMKVIVGVILEVMARVDSSSDVDSESGGHIGD